MQDLSDQQAIKRIKNGEIDYYTYIVKRYTGPIHGYVMKKMYQKEEVDDIVQNAFLSFYKAVPHFDEKRPVLPYLYEIVRNEIKMYLRSRKKTVPLNEQIASSPQEDEWYEADIQKALSTLPDEQKKALTWIAEGYSYEEVALHLRRPVNTVRTIIRRARLKIIKFKKV